MQLQLGTKLTIQEIEAVKSEIDNAMQGESTLEVITAKPIEEIDLTGVQLLLALSQNKKIELKISVEENQLQDLKNMGFDLRFIN